MRLALALAAILLAAGAGAGAIPISYRASVVGLSLVPTSGLPITLTAGPDGATSVSAARTSSTSTVSGGILSAQSSNVTKLENTWGAALRVRVALVSTSSVDGECVRCDLQIRHGATTSAQVTIANGVVTQATGPWVTLPPAGSSPHVVWLYAVAQGAVVAEKSEQVRVALQIEPAGGGSPHANYTSFATVTFRV